MPSNLEEESKTQITQDKPEDDEDDEDEDGKFRIKDPSRKLAKGFEHLNGNYRDVHREKKQRQVDQQ